jgi:hypothetical protein
MKFCRNLQRVINITDPEWAPYWTNYKMLKKFLKAVVGGGPSRSESPQSDMSDNTDDGGEDDRDHAHDTDDKKYDTPAQEEKMEAANGSARGIVGAAGEGSSSAAQMIRHPGEVAFFKLLNSELKKAIHFFDKAQLEFEIREARVREGIDIMRKANSLMVDEKWSLMAKSLYRLYKELLLLETYAIMTYCSFSKILKKHDKVTKHNTRVAFMKNVVNKANFSHYPKLLAMITRCERLYDEVSQSLIVEGKSGLYEDERLFINMIHRLNEQALDTAEGEGAPDLEGRKEQRRTNSLNSPDRLASGTRTNERAPSPRSSHSSLTSPSQVSTLRSIVNEITMTNNISRKGLGRIEQAEQAEQDMDNSNEGQDSSEQLDKTPSKTGKRSSDPTGLENESHPIAKRGRQNDILLTGRCR